MQPLAIHKALIATAIGATCISFAAPFVKWADMDPSAIGFYRCLFAAFALAPLALRTTPQSGRWLGKGARLAFISGVVFAMDLMSSSTGGVSTMKLRTCAQHQSAFW